MKYLVIAALLALAAARPQEEFVEAEPEPAQDSGSTLADAGIIRMDMSANEDGSFQYGYETTDPAQQDVAGEQRQIGEQAGTVMQGSYSFTSPEGENIVINWVADENGFQAQGDAIPVAPEDPNAAAQAAAYAAAGGVAEPEAVL